MDEKKYVSIKEAAEILGVNRKHIYRLLERGQLHRVDTGLYRVGGPVRIPRSEVLALLPR